MAKLLSICIPTYNRAKFLERLLKQIVDETSGLEACVEIVVSDNCSDDNTAQVLRKFSSKANLRYARNKANFRYDVNVVKCLSLARGKFCWLMGDDDLFVGGQIRKMVSVLDGCDETVGGVLQIISWGERFQHSSFGRMGSRYVKRLSMSMISMLRATGQLS